MFEILFGAVRVLELVSVCIAMSRVNGKVLYESRYSAMQANIRCQHVSSS